MSNLKLFMKDNKEIKKNVKYSATKSLKDENGTPLEWEIKPLSTKEFDMIREDCQNKGRFDNSKYIAKLICASVSVPNLNNVELQNSYGVRCCEDLIKEMLSPSEYVSLSEFVQNFNGFTTIEEDIKTAKN